MIHSIHSIDKSQVENNSINQETLQALLNSVTKQGIKGDGIEVNEGAWFGDTPYTISKNGDQYICNGTNVNLYPRLVDTSTSFELTDEENEYIFGITNAQNTQETTFSNTSIPSAKVPGKTYSINYIQKINDYIVPATNEVIDTVMYFEVTFNNQYIIVGVANNTYADTLLFDVNDPRETAISIDSSYYHDDINNVIYPYVAELYNKLVFNNNAVIKQYIICSIFDSICNDICNDSECEGASMYIPAGYVFKYTYNTNDPAYIYFNTEDIPINFIIFDNDLSEYDNTMQHILFKCNKPKESVERVINYNYNVLYDYETSIIPIIDRVNCTSVHLPYINKEGYWVVNGKETSIYAKGKNAGNPNIVIVKSNSTSPNDYTILSRQGEEFLTDSSDEHQLAFKLRYTHIDPEKIILNLDPNYDEETQYYDNQNTANNDITICCWVPDDLTASDNNYDEIKTFVENCIIFSISNSDCTGNETQKANFEKYYGKDGVITTIWIPDFNEDETEFTFTCIENNEGIAVDFDYLANTSNIVKWWVENHVPKPADKYTFTSLVFDEVNAKEKQNSAPDSHIYPVIKNNTKDNYTIPQYNNNYNLGIEYCNLTYNTENVSNDSTADSYFVFKKHYEIGHDHYFKHTTDNGHINMLTDFNIDSSYAVFIPNYDIPTVDLSEVLLRNTHVINRLNILNYDQNSNYYSYIGCSYDTNLPIRALTIGSSKVNYDMGENTMINDDPESNDANRYSFNDISEMYINMDNTRINGYTYIRTDLIAEGDSITYNTFWYKTVIPGKSEILWSAHYLPRGTFIKNEANNQVQVNLNRESTGMDVLVNNPNIFHTATTNQSLFVPCTVPETINNKIYDIYYFDGIYLPELLHRIGLGRFVNPNGQVTIQNTNITSNMNIYKYNGKNVILQTTNQLLKPVYNDEDNDSINSFKPSFTLGTGLYTGNMLDISYYISGETTLNITINEVMPNDITAYAKIINTEY